MDKLSVRAILAMDDRTLAALTEQQDAENAKALAGQQAMDDTPVVYKSIGFSEMVLTVLREIAPKVAVWPAFPHEPEQKLLPHFDRRYDFPDVREAKITFVEAQHLLAAFTAPKASRTAVEFNTNHMLHYLKKSSHEGERCMVIHITRMHCFHSLASRQVLIRMSEEIEDGEEEIPKTSSLGSPFDEDKFDFHVADVRALADLAANSFAYDVDTKTIIVDFRDVIKLLPIFMNGKAQPAFYEFQPPRTLW